MLERIKRESFNLTRQSAEIPIQHYLKNHGFVEVANPSRATDLRLRTMKAMWALKGLDFLIGEELTVAHDRDFNNQDTWQYFSDPRLQGVIQRISAIPSRRNLLISTIDEAHNPDRENPRALAARQRLENMMAVIHAPNRTGSGRHKALILTQTAYLLGRRDLPYGLNTWLDAAIQLGGGSLPYLGAAVLFSELMNTGAFSHVDIVDFKDEKTINSIIDDPERYDGVFVSGATSLDYKHTFDLNRRLINAGFPVMHGGIAATNLLQPEFYTDNGGAVFIGEVEGAGHSLVNWLDSSGPSTVFLRGRETDMTNRNRRLIRKLRLDGTPFHILDHLPPRIDMKEMYSVEREQNGYLARRMEALARMNKLMKWRDTWYEPPPTFRPHQTLVSHGCPETCTFCATVSTQGTQMRARPLDSIIQEWKAVDPRYIAAVDQNLTANGRKFFESLLIAAEALGKKIAFQSELGFFNIGPDSFFDGTSTDRIRELLLQNAVLGIEVGLEQPTTVLGVSTKRKNPARFVDALNRLNRLGIITFATAIVGMPKTLLMEDHTDIDKMLPRDDMTTKEWDAMLEAWRHWLVDVLPSPGVIPFAFTLIPFTTAHHILKSQGLLKRTDEELILGRDITNLFAGPDSDVIKGLLIQDAIDEIRSQVYSFPSIWKRMRAANFSPKTWTFMALFNIVIRYMLRPRME